MPASGNGTGTPEDELRARADDVERQTAKAMEQFVAKPSFGRILVTAAENVAALTRIGSDLADMALRNLRIAGRADVARLARQLQRTEDKLERVLQEVELLRDEQAERQREDQAGRERDERAERKRDEQATVPFT